MIQVFWNAESEFCYTESEKTDFEATFFMHVTIF